MATFTEEYSDYIAADNKRLIYKKGVLSINAEGNLAGQIPASLFGMRKIHSVTCGGLTTAADTSKSFGIYPNQTSLFAYDFADAPATLVPKSLTGSFLVVVTGE